ncbi:transmembrane protein, putative (macronuclear) [Tetrahymena thermophila SB210]|uniref:Transmembrane protein, putative n=1 Tax=Tetrahymena thermophila (strain SB210) TaxID=312017 RepID=W7XGK4_TETTS|nr:transmembrane protein, putative [Tetrahymena thermophila SB210]EWS72054.1 transmembrane protein, putative [Tetrahymena thermophila SB210]|eukprot:XP_012655429.1 transmembrane protein, putative [Tetrahymena thermophila SB210]
MILMKMSIMIAKQMGYNKLKLINNINKKKENQIYPNQTKCLKKIQTGREKKWQQILMKKMKQRRKRKKNSRKKERHIIMKESSQKKQQQRTRKKMFDNKVERLNKNVQKKIKNCKRIKNKDYKLIQIMFVQIKFRFIYYIQLYQEISAIHFISIFIQHTNLIDIQIYLQNKQKIESIYLFLQLCLFVCLKFISFCMFIIDITKYYLLICQQTNE